MNNNGLYEDDRITAST